MPFLQISETVFINWEKVFKVIVLNERTVTVFFVGGHCETFTDECAEIIMKFVKEKKDE